MSTLGTQTVTYARLQLPAWGVWYADVEIAEAEELSGQVTLVLADRSWVGTVVSGGLYQGRARYRVAGGAGQWGKVIAEQGYANDAGVKSSTVIVDAARLAGETVNTPPETRVGPHYSRNAGPASAALNALASKAWYVDDDGVTQFGARPSATYDGEATLTSLQPDAQTATYATESLVGFDPGVTADGVTASDVEVVQTDKRLTVKLFGEVSGSRSTNALQALIEQLMPDVRYRGTYEFRVKSQEGERLNLQPVRAAFGLPELTRVPIRYGIPGFRSTVPDGSLVLVGFVNSEGGRPFVCGFPDADSDGWAPIDSTLEVSGDLTVNCTNATLTASGDVTVDAAGDVDVAADGAATVDAPEINLGAAAALAAARTTDPVIAGAFSGTIVGPGSAITKIA